MNPYTRAYQNGNAQRRRELLDQVEEAAIKVLDLGVPLSADVRQMLESRRAEIQARINAKRPVGRAQR